MAIWYWKVDETCVAEFSSEKQASDALEAAPKLLIVIHDGDYVGINKLDIHIDKG